MKRILGIGAVITGIAVLIVSLPSWIWMLATGGLLIWFGWMLYFTKWWKGWVNANICIKTPKNPRQICQNHSRSVWSQKVEKACWSGTLIFIWLSLLFRNVSNWCIHWFSLY